MLTLALSTVLTLAPTALHTGPNRIGEAYPLDNTGQHVLESSGRSIAQSSTWGDYWDTYKHELTSSGQVVIQRTLTDPRNTH